MDGVSAEYTCPHCQQSMLIEDGQPEQIIVCTHCGGEFALPAIEEPTELSSVPQQEELDALRIRQLAMMKRTAYRGKSYAIIAAGACSVAVAEIGLMTLREVLTSGWGIWSIGYVVTGIFAIWGAWHFTGKAMEMHRQAAKSLIASNEGATPDFSGLGDGSQQVRNLEEMR